MFVLFPLLVLTFIFVIAALRTWKIQHAPEQKLFLKGKLSNKPLDGKYKGIVRNLKTGWQGKSFNSQNSTGINNLKQGDKEVEKYPFKTYQGKGIQDKNLDVFKIDYNIPENPFYIRFVLDEIVEVEKDKYLGKVHLRFLPGITFSVGYFRLEKYK